MAGATMGGRGTLARLALGALAYAQRHRGDPEASRLLELAGELAERPLDAQWNSSASPEAGEARPAERPPERPAATSYWWQRD